MHIFFVCVRQQMYLCSRFFKVLLKQDMKTKAILAGIMLAATATTAQAGGILTNTNQSIDFLRNPARDAAIGLDGVYSNPAGVAFLPEGFHLGFNWQYAQVHTSILERRTTVLIRRPSKVWLMHPVFLLSRLPGTKVIGVCSSTSRFLVVVAHVSLPMDWVRSSALLVTLLKAL